MLCYRSLLQPLPCGTLTAPGAQQGSDQAAAMAPALLVSLCQRNSNSSNGNDSSHSLWLTGAGKVEDYLSKEHLLEMQQPHEAQAASTVRSFHILQQESPEEEKAGVKKSILQSDTRPHCRTHPAQPAHSLAFQRAASLLNALLCPVSDSTSGPAMHYSPSRLVYLLPLIHQQLSQNTSGLPWHPPLTTGHFLQASCSIKASCTWKSQRIQYFWSTYCFIQWESVWSALPPWALLELS